MIDHQDLDRGYRGFIILSRDMSNLEIFYTGFRSFLKERSICER